MAGFDDFDVEIENSKESDVEMFVGSVATAGSPITIVPATGRIIRHTTIYNPRKGPNANAFADVLLYSVDGGTTYHSLPRGEWEHIPGNYTDFRIDTNNNGTNYEVKVWS